MLLPWRKATRLFVAPQGFGLLGASSVNGAHALELLPTPLATATRDEAMLALARRLAEPDCKGSVEIIFSSHFLHFMALPWHDELEGKQEWQAYAGQSFTSAFGLDVARHVIRTATQRYRAPVLATATDSALLEALLAAIAAAGRRVAAVTPYAIWLFNRSLNDLAGGGGDFWLFMVEQGRAAVMRVNGNVVTQFSSRTLEHGLPAGDDIAALIARELARTPDDPANTTVYLAAEAGGDIPGLDGLTHLVPLTPQRAAGHVFGMVTC